MTYIKFYQPYYSAYRDENTNSAYDQLVNRFSNRYSVPAANIVETDKEYLVEMSLPGVDKNAISIKHEHGLLNVSVEEKQNENSDERYSCKEFDYTGSSRVFKTGDKVDADKITARYENGILMISLPKKEAFIKKPAQMISIQ